MVFRRMMLCPIVCIIEFSWSPIYSEFLLAISVSKQVEAHIHGLCPLGFISPLTTASAVEFYVFNGVGAVCVPFLPKCFWSIPPPKPWYIVPQILLLLLMTLHVLLCGICWGLLRCFAVWWNRLIRKSGLLPCCVILVRWGSWRRCVTPVSCHLHWMWERILLVLKCNQWYVGSVALFLLLKVADCEAIALIGHTKVLYNARPRNKNLPHTCWMNFLPFLLRSGAVDCGVGYCFFAP